MKKTLTTTRLSTSTKISVWFIVGTAIFALITGIVGMIVYFINP